MTKIIFLIIFSFFSVLVEVQAFEEFEIPKTNDKSEKLLIIKQITFQGNRVFSEKELNAVISNLVNQNITIIKIQQIITKIREFYREQGYINADAYIVTEQDLSSGIIKIVIDEGILEKIEIKGLSTLNESYIFKRLPKVDSPLNILELEKALILLEQNKLLFKEIKSTLIKGSQSNSSILTIDIIENKRFSLEIEGNNFGAFNSGENQLESDLGINNIIGYGDRVETDFTISEGSGQIIFDYYFPLAPQYGEIRFHYDYGESEIIRQPLDDFDIRGIYQQGFIEWRLSVFEAIREKLFVSFSTGVENSRNFVLGEPFSFIPEVPDSGYTIYNFRVATDYLNSFEKSAISARGELSLNWDSLDNTNNPIAIVRTQANYINQLHERILLSTNFAGQFSTGSLAGGSTFGVLPSEQFPIGGFESVPGYDLYLRRGDNGISLAINIYSTIFNSEEWGTIQFVPFVAYGKVWNESLSPLEPTNLASTGIEWHWDVKNWYIRLGVAIPLIEVDPDFERPFYFSVGKKINF